MDIQYVYAAVFATRMEPAIGFYSALLGRAPDDRPMPTLVQWRGVAGAGVQVFLDAQRAGGGTMTLVVADLQACLDGLVAPGVSAGPVHTGDFGKVCQLRDPDDNLVVLAEPPPR